MGLSHTVSGDIASFRTPSKVPIESLKFHFLPKQATGTPSPENPIPIEGWTGLNGKRTHKNIIKPRYSDQEVKNGLTITPTSNGIKVKGTASARTACFLAGTDVLFLDLGKKYTFSLYLNGDISECENPFLGYYTSPYVWGAVISQLNTTNEYVYQWIVPSKYAEASDPHIDAYIYVPSGITVDFEIGLQMEAGENATNYEPYSEEPIPITFPSNGKNRYHYDENNIEEGLITTTGYTRAVYHTGVFGDGRKVSISGSIIEAGVVSNTSLNVGYLKDGIITIKNAFINYADGSITSRSFVVPSGYEFVIVTTDISGYALKRNLPRYNIQIEYADSPTTYEPYSSDSTFYGGCIDPVAGEIVAEYVSKICDGSENGWSTNSTSGSNTRFHITPSGLGLPKPVNSSTSLAKFSYFNSSTSSSAWNGFIGSTGNVLFFVPTDTASTVAEWKEYLSEHNLQICYKLAEPIHIPIAPQDLKAFLDHNNFWSDANDITEVTYPVTESKDILATRKKAMAFDHAHHKKVKWNQVSIDGNFALNATNYSWNTNYGTLNIADNKITWTSTQVPLQYYNTGVMYKTNYLQIPWNHKVLVMAKVKTSAGSGNLIRIFGMVSSSGGAHTYDYNIEVPSNEWTMVKGFIRARPENPPSGIDDTIIKKFKILIGKKSGYEFDTVCPIGTTLECDMLMAFDLTQMFGLGNEPQTVAEFEHICEINGIDLTTYQPYDEGSDRWLIVP